jgi:hypothetical protein
MPCLLQSAPGSYDGGVKGWGAAAVATAASGCASLSSQWQHEGLPVLGLVDWNPRGVGVLLAHKYGCAALGLSLTGECARSCVLGCCGSDA